MSFDPRVRFGTRPTMGVALVSAVALTVTGVAVLTATSAHATTPDTIWGTGSPTSAVVDSDTSAVELGTRFTPVVAGQVTGIRFYKTPENSGTHTGSLWSSTGTLLGRVTFGGETSSGWQTAALSSPVTLTPGTGYVVSYHTNIGRYLSTELYSGVSASANLKVPTSNIGVYSYGTGSSFPTSSWHSSMYWVDLTFSAGGSGTPTPVSTPTTAPGTTTSSTPTVTATATTTTPTPTPTATGSTATSSPSVTAVASTTSPTNKTTKQSSKSPTLCTTSSVWSNLAACGWPGAANTGYPDGQVFSKTVTGGLTVSTDNTVIDGYRISGGVTVNAKNVTIRNSWITNSAGGANGTGVVKILNGASATIDHNLLDGQNATHTCVWHEGASMVVTANECTGVNDGIFSWATTVGVDGTGDNFTISDNWLHNFTTLAANGHVDGYQTEGAKNGVISHNTFDVAQDQTSAIAIWNGRKDASNIAVTNNLIQGGGFSVYAEDYSPSETSPAGGYTVTNITFTNNRFSNSRYACVGSYGVWFTRGAPSDGWHRSGNVLLETGQNLDNNNPIVNGWECR
jgi:Domain of unknown function (DUF4082)